MHLWDVYTNAELLDEKKASMFQSVTTKILYLSNRTRLDIELSITFCTARMQNPNVEDWKKYEDVSRG